jgi:hypothetical protein
MHTSLDGEWRGVPDKHVPTLAGFEWLRPPPAKKEFRGILSVS